MFKTQSSIKKYLKTISFLRRIKNYIWNIFNIGGIRGTTVIDIVDTFPMFKPNSAGSYTARATLTIQAIHDIIPSLLLLSQSLHRHTLNQISIDTCKDKPENAQWIINLKKLFDKYGSDKASSHNYHYLYGEILHNTKISTILEIGLGTNNTNLVSNMGIEGKPGASLRAFRDLLPHTMIYGADIDKEILFEDERIKTFFVDQTTPQSLDSLGAHVPSQFDLIIDDGLHSPHANINTLVFALPRLKIGGWVVIEDIATPTIPVWEFVANLLPSQYESRLYRDRDSSLFCVSRLS